MRVCGRACVVSVETGFLTGELGRGQGTGFCWCLSGEPPRSPEARGPGAPRAKDTRCEEGTAPHPCCLVPPGCCGICRRGALGAEPRVHTALPPEAGPLGPQQSHVCGEARKAGACVA